MRNEDNLISTEEFSELIQHLNLEEILAVEYCIGATWRKLIQQINSVNKLFECNLCSIVRCTKKDLYAHLDGEKHKSQMGNVIHLYHPEYTYPKDELLKSTKSINNQNVLNVNTNSNNEASISTNQEILGENTGVTNEQNDAYACVNYGKNFKQSNNNPDMKNLICQVYIKNESIENFADDPIIDNFSNLPLKKDEKCAKKNMELKEKNLEGNAKQRKHFTSIINSVSHMKRCRVRLQKLPSKIWKNTYQNQNESNSDIVVTPDTSNIKYSDEWMEVTIDPLMKRKIQLEKSSTACNNDKEIQKPKNRINCSLTIKELNTDDINKTHERQKRTLLSEKNYSVHKNKLDNLEEVIKTSKSLNPQISKHLDNKEKLQKQQNSSSKGKERLNATKTSTDTTTSNAIFSTNVAPTTSTSNKNMMDTKNLNPNENKGKLLSSYKIPVLQGRISVKPASQLIKTSFLLADEHDNKNTHIKNNSSDNTTADCEDEVIEITDSPERNEQQQVEEPFEKNQREKSPVTEVGKSTAEQETCFTKKRIVINPVAVHLERHQNTVEENDNSIAYEKNKIITPTKHKVKSKIVTPASISRTNKDDQISFTSKSFTKCAYDSDIRGLLGVEYVIKILKNRDDNMPRYECGLCELILDGFAMQNHLEGYNHRLKYCEKHFPTALRHYNQYISEVPEHETYKIMTPILRKLAVAIEKHYGRNMPQECFERNYNVNRHDVLAKAYSQRHACEQYGPSFTHVLDSKEIDKYIAERHLYKPLNTTRDTIFDKRLNDRHGVTDYRYHDRTDRRSERNNNPESSAIKHDHHRYIDHEKEKRSTHDIRHALTSSVSTVQKSYASVLDNSTLDPVDDETHRRMVETFLRSTLKEPKSNRYDKSITSRSHSINSRQFRSPSRERKRLPSPNNVNYKIKRGEPSRKRVRTPEETVRKNDIWQEYKMAVDEQLKILSDEYSSYENNLEKHPKYNQEWQKFWKRRKDELIANNLDYRKHDYQPEWVIFFNQRVKELYVKEVETMKINLREKFHLPLTNDLLTDTKYHVHLPWEDSPLKSLNNINIPNSFTSQLSSTGTSNSTPQVVSVLRLMTALEEHLGSLGVKITNLLTKALQTEKSNPQNVNSIILNEENCCLIETAKEKFKGLILAGIYDGCTARALNKAIEETEALLNYIEAQRINQPTVSINSLQNADNINETSVLTSTKAYVPTVSPVQLMPTMPSTLSSSIRSKEATLFPSSSLQTRSGIQYALEEQQQQKKQQQYHLLHQQQQLTSISQCANQIVNARPAPNQAETTILPNSSSNQLPSNKEDLTDKLANIFRAHGKTDVDSDTLNKLGAIISIIEKKKRESIKKKTLSDILMDLVQKKSNKNDNTVESEQNNTAVYINNTNNNNNSGHSVTPVQNLSLTQNANMTSSLLGPNTGLSSMPAAINTINYQGYQTSSSSVSSNLIVGNTFSGGNYVNNNNRTTTITNNTLNQSNFNAYETSGNMFSYNNNNNTDNNSNNGGNNIKNNNNTTSRNLMMPYEQQQQSRPQQQQNYQPYQNQLVQQQQQYYANHNNTRNNFNSYQTANNHANSYNTTSAWNMNYAWPQSYNVGSNIPNTSTNSNSVERGGPPPNNIQSPWKRY